MLTVRGCVTEALLSMYSLWLNSLKSAGLKLKFFLLQVSQLRVEGWGWTGSVPKFFESDLAWRYSHGCGHACCLRTFSDHTFPLQSTFHECLLTQHSVNKEPFQPWPSVIHPHCGGCQWVSFRQVSTQQSSKWLWLELFSGLCDCWTPTDNKQTPITPSTLLWANSNDISFNICTDGVFVEW